MDNNTEDKKIINIASFRKNLKTDIDDVDGANAGWVQAGIDILNSLDPDDAQAVVQFLINYVFKEVEAGLGLVDTPDEVDLQVFNKIAGIYERAAGGCYFCSKGIDPNEDEFGSETKLCLMCKLKLANFTEALGISAGKVFKGVPVRSAQKTRIKIEE